MFWNYMEYSNTYLGYRINRKHEMFWNEIISIVFMSLNLRLTVNMKCFEIIKELLGKMFEKINRKHEMFWNYHLYTLESMIEVINRKHEMFWNDLLTDNISAFGLLTINMKCF